MSSITLQRPAPNPAHAPTAPGTQLAQPTFQVGFVLFIILNFLLYVRPTEVIPGLVGLELYQYTIVFCLLSSFQILFVELRHLTERPMTWCILGVNLTIVLSCLANLHLGEAFVGGVEFLKVVLYFLLFLGLVSTPARLHTFLWWLSVFITLCALMTVLVFYDVIQLPNLSKLKDGDMLRLRGSGVFADPNDLCVLLNVGILLSLYWLTEGNRSWGARLIWLAPLALLFYSLSLTQSRGGLLALFAGLAVLLRARFGWHRAIVLGICLLPCLLLFVGERQATLTTEKGTGQDRIQLWSDGLEMFRSAPILGVGYGQFEEEAKQVAHNSYLHAFAELGLVGGGCFLGAWVAGLLGLNKFCRDRVNVLNPDLKRLQPFLMGAVASYMAGMMTLSLATLVPTWTMVALCAVYCRQAVAVPAVAPQKVDSRFVRLVVVLSVTFLLCMYAFVRVAVSRG